ncbi:O-antigen ligase [Tenacibaculum tangerinum]|uniref:O-antigen ligase n=1 Tax=Tenacibaculum tangerinum TaxID=3038772 RepID=A0ABY8L9D4_9FLAO|nr:O-antigen polymerase [Tenacibaculum tangerinum]WGH76983.1 O-antigen ligase [Tenacibaculum tangerinum]
MEQLKHRFLIFIFLILSLTFLLLGFYILSISMLFITSIIISKIYINYSSFILHWVNPFMLLHNFSYYIYLLIIVDNQSLNQGFIRPMLIMGYISFTTFNLLTIYFFERNKKRMSKLKKIKIDPYVFKIIWILSLLSVLIYLSVIYTTNSLNTKRMIKNFIADNPVLRYLYAITGLLVTLSIYNVYKNGYNRKLMLLYGFLFCFIFLFLGERDLLFTYIIGVIFFYGYKKKCFPIFIYYSFFIFVALLAPLTQQLKSVLVSEDKLNIESDFKSMGFNEFMTVGKNIHRVYGVNKLKTIEDKKLIIDDFGNFLGITRNSGNWYNRVFLERPQGSTGLGYSLQLSGYMDFEYFGVFIVYFIVSIFTSKYYNYLNSSVLGLSFLVTLVSLLIYVQRQDLAYFLNFSIKFIVVPFIILTKTKLVKK